VLVVWKLDRLGRSLPHLIETVTTLGRRGVGFKSLTEGVDTSTPNGRLVFHIFGALAEFERDLIRERTGAGLRAAAARGRKGGRKPVITPEKLGGQKRCSWRGSTCGRRPDGLRSAKPPYTRLSPVNSRRIVSN
jgi:DNA invertase Pin-like site-specific DNA recombinase